MDCLVGFTVHERPPEIFFHRHTAMNEKHTHPSQPLSVTPVDPQGFRCGGMRRKYSPDILCTQWVIEKVIKTTSDGSESITTPFSTVVAGDVAMECKKILKGY
jgi:hypothetical protein